MRTCKTPPRVYVALRLRNSVAAAPFILLLCFATPPCHAGHYDIPHYSGGQIAMYPGPPQPVPYSQGQNGWGSGGGAGGSIASTACSGNITTTFAWVSYGEGDPPPAQVIIKETCSASWTSVTFGTPHGACSNGLGFPENDGPGTPGPPGSTSTSGLSQGTRYKIVAGTDPLQIECEPNASSGGGIVTNLSSVWYTASATPVEVILTGGIGPNEAKRFLIGQLVTGTVATGGLTADGYDWCIGGGTPFKDYTASNTNGVFTALGIESGATCTFHFSRPGNATVTCTVHLTVPAGAKPEGGLLAAPSRNCGVDTPTFDIKQAIGSATFLPSNNPAASMQLSGASLDAPGGPYSGAGMIWRGYVSVPDAYIVPCGFGAWGYAQIITPHITFVLNGENWGLTAAWDGVARIDSGFTYLHDDHSGAGAWFNEPDSPGTGFAAGQTAVTMSMSFDTYMMFKPGGDGSCYVPLRAFRWAWDADATRAGDGTWSFNSKHSGPITGLGDYPQHPTWDKLWNNDPQFEKKP